ncbi:MAG: 2Fe-2S iron-sulfur cluster-binding protein [Gemmatimonadota bacterium]|nr:2Fe-2S iron-sulfur cluster-binding protein [Gemmatimonadota bacterium]
MNAPANGTVRLTIDGVEVTVPAGTTVLQAAERAGVVVPHYCYHPGIPSRPAQCRMCLVEVEGQPKLQPSCVLGALDGMEVRTQTEQAREARRSVIEFLLLHHPLDCPICDAAGQCMLQDYAYETGQLKSRFEEAKLVLGRDRIADDILYFADRCILCTRCVRFMRDVAQDDALIVAQRGHKAYIDTFPGRDLDNLFRGNIVDVCPVGALVHEDFLFKARAWDFDSAPGICGGCANGCNIDVDVKENQVVRVKPRHNGAVNGWWMCDEGRRDLVMWNRGRRIDLPLVRRDGELAPVHWGDALAHVAAALGNVRGGVALASAFVENESLYFLRRLLGRLEITGGGFRVARGEERALPGFPSLALRAERAPNGEGARMLGFTETDALPEAPADGALVVLGDRLEGAPADFGKRAGFFLYAGTHLSEAAGNADVILPVAGYPETDGTFVSHEGRVQRFRQALQPPGVARPAWLVLARLVELLGEDGAAVRDAPAAFAALAADHPAFAGLDWNGLGLKGAAAAAAATAE